MFTKFYDMSSGGRRKENFDTLLVELPKEEAIEWFINKYGHNPYNVTCQCCGADYSVYEVDDDGYMDVDADLIIRKENLND